MLCISKKLFTFVYRTKNTHFTPKQPYYGDERPHQAHYGRAAHESTGVC